MKIFTFPQRDQLQVEFKIKLPSEIFALDLSADGNHFSLGLGDGSLIIKSKQKEHVEELDAEDKLLKQFEPQQVKTSKDYKYFNRGQYQVRADPEDLKALKGQKKAKLQAYESALKKFEYRDALDKAVETKNPEVVVALMEELCERGGVHQALSQRSEESLCELMQFFVWKLADHRYCQVLVPAAKVLI